MGDSFDWNSLGLSWVHFHSLVNLLSLRNGGQAESSTLSEHVLEEDYETDDNEEDDSPSIDTRVPHQISNSGHSRLKRRFLDCLAEFAANKKGGQAVACSAIKEAEDNVIIWVTRNEGFSDVDKPVYDKLAKLLALLSGDGADRSENLLWEEMVLYHQHRIEHSYIPELRASFKAYDAFSNSNETSTSDDNSAFRTPLSILRSLLFDNNLHTTSILEKYKELILASYNLRRARTIEEELYKSPRATSRSKSLWLNICLLARLRVAFHIFKDIAMTLPSFEKATFILVPRTSSSEKHPQRSLTLKQTFGTLQLSFQMSTVQAVLGQNWTIAKVEREFTRRQKQKPNVHAEVQMLICLSTNESNTTDIFPYLGCSKLSCFMCNCFIQSYGRFSTRGCHGRLFKPWTVPGIDQLFPGQAKRIAEALKIVQDEVVKKLTASTRGHIQLERTSVIGGSSVLDGWENERSPRQSQIDRLRLKMERDRVSEMFRRYCAEGHKTNRRHDQHKESYFSTGEEEAHESECDICMRTTKRRCTICNKGSFCSEPCQEKRSGSHLFTCSKRSLTTADYLLRSLADDLIPEDENVLEDFGFNNLSFVRERTYLFGLYRGLYIFGSFNPEMIHEWRIGGILADKIKEFYYQMPENSRGQYFPWFLKNSHVLERPMTKEEAEERLMATFYDKARPYLDIEDRDTIAKDLKPKAKRDSYTLLAEMLLRISPNPRETNWYSFGFVTCRESSEESMLLDLYQLLLTESDGSFFYEFHNSRRRGDFRPVTFTQFWNAYEAGTLIQLMDSKGLKELRSRLPLLEGFLSVAPTAPRPSVWDLKQFLEINDPMEYPPIPSVNVDYGFINCPTFEETCILMEIYGKILKTANPLDLHQACVTGDLFNFASKYIRMEEKWRNLMGNLYPLLEEGLETEGEAVGLLSLFSRLWTFISESAL